MQREGNAIKVLFKNTPLHVSDLQRFTLRFSDVFTVTVKLSNPKQSLS